MKKSSSGAARSSKKFDVKNVANSAKDLGTVAAGFFGANVLSKSVVKKDSALINGGIAAGALIAGSMTRNQMIKNIATGLSLFFATKALNNTVAAVNGLAGVPESVKTVMAKVVPNLGSAIGYDSIGALSDNELMLLQGAFGNPGTEIPASVPQPRMAISY